MRRTQAAALPALEIPTSCGGTGQAILATTCRRLHQAHLIDWQHEVERGKWRHNAARIGPLTEALRVLLKQGFEEQDMFEGTTTTCRLIYYEKRHRRVRDRLLALSRWTTHELLHLKAIKDAFRQAIAMTGFKEQELEQLIWPKVLLHVKKARREKESDEEAARGQTSEEEALDDGREATLSRTA